VTAPVAGTPYYGPSTTEKPTLMMEQGMGVFTAVAEEARVMVDTVKLCSRLFGKDVKFPSWAESLVGGVSGGAAFASCEFNAFQAHVNTAEMMMCPLKLGSQGFDFMNFFMKHMLHMKMGLGESGVEAKKL